MTACFHCGEHCIDTLHAELDGSERAFCCVGCRTVAEMIFAQGLQSYYERRRSTAKKPDLIPEEWLLEATQTHVTHQDGHTAAVTLFIEDISCVACSWLIERSLRQLPAVKTVSSNLTARRTFIEWDDNITPLSTLLNQLQKIGYRALPYTQDHVEDRLEKENLALLKRLTVAAFGMMQAMMYTFGLYFGLVSDLSAHDASWLRWAGLFCTLPVVVYSAWPFYRNALKALRQKTVNMDLSVSLGIVAAFIVSAINTVNAQGHVYFDSIAMFAFLLLGGRYLEARLRDAANKTSALQQRLLPTRVSCWRDQQWQWVALNSIKTGDQIRVAAGDVLAIDGEVIAGSGSIDERIVSGESVPVTKSVGASVLAGSVVQGGTLDIRVAAEGQHTYLAQLSHLQDQALAQRPSWQMLADRIAHYFVIAVIVIATAAYFWWQHHDPQKAFDVLLAVLVVTCPCALSLALPTAWAAATKTLLQKGFLIRRAQTLAALSRITTVVLDKTGTLTTGKFALSSITVHGTQSQATCLKWAAALEQHSRHPIARAFDRYRDGQIVALDVQEQSGVGLIGEIDGEIFFIGRREGLPEALRPHDDRAQFYLANQSQLLASFDLRDELRTDAHYFVQRLREVGLHIVIASGDRADNVHSCADKLGISDVHARLLPEQKLELVRRLQSDGESVLMIGDGINDAPVLAGADASIAVGDGVDFARRAADAVLNKASLTVIVEALQLSHRTRHIVRQNLIWAIVYNVLALPSAILGVLSPWEAALGMSISSLLVTLNSLRLQSTPTHAKRLATTTEKQTI